MIRFLAKLVLILGVVTVVGQVRTNGKSLESHYHSAVNSPGFQKAYWTAVRPATWAYEKVVFLVNGPDRAAAR